VILFAYALTPVETVWASRSYAAYSSVYLAASLMWMRTVEKITPDRWGLTGAAICLVGAGVIRYAPR